MRFISLLIILIITAFISSRTKEEWKSRSIYQLLTDRFARTTDTGNCNYSQYCGGNYQGIINKLDYIKGMGFDAIWISPIVENAEGSYHAYHTVNFYGINENFGTEQDIHDLIEECHKNDIYVVKSKAIRTAIGFIGSFIK